MTGFRSNIIQMHGYTPGEQINDPGVIKLNTNENPYPPSPLVFEAIRRTLTGDKLRKYPEASGQSFRRAAAEVLGIDPESILIGNGSDDILTILTRAYVPEGGLIVSMTPSYSLYKSLAEIQGSRFQTIPFEEDWSLPKPLNLPKNTSIFYLANPNSPSGTAIPVRTIEALLDSVSCPIVIDEAYADFAVENALSLASRPNVIVTRTFSKSMSLAGIRFGYAVARPETIAELIKVKDSYNCDVLCLAAAQAAIEDQAYMRETRAKIVATRERMFGELTKLGFQITPSQANFLWCRRSDRSAKPIYEELKKRLILVRYMQYAGYGDGLRITVGTNAEIDRLLEVLRGII